MIRNVQIDRSAIRPGERRNLTVDGDGPMTIAINCFTDDPPPPGYKPCDACGTLTAWNGQTVKVVADRRFFTRNHGYLDISIKDASGDFVRVRLDVRSQTNPSGTMTAGA